MTLHITILNNKLYIISRNNPTACVICWIDFFKQQLFLIYIFRLSKKQVKPQFHWVWSLLKLVTTLLTTINQTTRSDLWPCSCYTWNHFNGNHTPALLHFMNMFHLCTDTQVEAFNNPASIQSPYIHIAQLPPAKLCYTKYLRWCARTNVFVWWRLVFWNYA